jgi:chromosomal replication initiator protein
MPEQTDSDAAILWDDVLDLLARENISQSLLEMLKSCVPVDLTEDHLEISTTARFIQRTIEKNRSIVESSLLKVAFQPLTLTVTLAKADATPSLDTTNAISQEEFDRITNKEQSLPNIQPEGRETSQAADNNGAQPLQSSNPLVDTITEADSKLTFERFIKGKENEMALAAAKQVANGINKTYNPLFIYGKSGLGKTHLLKAIQNYIVKNDPSRICVYRASREFTNDYINAMVNTEKSIKDQFEQNYHRVDVLIIDDIQYLKPNGATLEFFFDLFNYLRDHGKQIVLAADRSPSELGIGEGGFDERITSRIDSGVTCPISAPEYELKYALVKAFYERMKEDAATENIPGLDATLTEDNLQLMAELSGSNIRVIESFCQQCLIMASRDEKYEGHPITREEIIKEARHRWPEGQRNVTVESIQKAIESEYGITHSDLIGNKRTKEIMIPRHIAIWLTRELTDNTLAEIGNKFGGRSHATVKHSISWVDEQKKKDRRLYDQLTRMSDQLRNT